MPKPSAPAAVDVLVVGQHPAAFLAVHLLAQDTSLKLLHALGSAGPQPDRLTLINPQLFSLAPQLEQLQPQLDLTAIHGLHFLADDPQVQNQSTGKTVAAYVGVFKQIHQALSALTAKTAPPVSGALQLGDPDESGVPVRVGRRQFRARLLILSDGVDPEVRAALGVPPQWDADVPHVYTFAKLRGNHGYQLPTDPTSQVIPLSLDLGGSLTSATSPATGWAWLLPGPGCVQLAIMQTPAAARQTPPRQQLSHWAAVLAAHGILKVGPADLDPIHTLEWPLAGALVQEAVANRALLIGPAGGFVTACGEDIYPGCWSAVLAAQTARHALGERHLQDALQAYRQQWGATIGDYLRGPQQNLRFLLPLIYRNPMMAARLTDAILLGKSVVR